MAANVNVSRPPTSPTVAAPQPLNKCRIELKSPQPEALEKKHRHCRSEQATVRPQEKPDDARLLCDLVLGRNFRDPVLDLNRTPSRPGHELSRCRYWRLRPFCHPLQKRSHQNPIDFLFFIDRGNAVPALDLVNCPFEYR